MKQTKLTKLIAAVIAALLLLSLFACGKDDAGENETTAGDTTTIEDTTSIENTTAEITTGNDTTTVDETTIADDATTSGETTESDETEPHTHIYGDWETIKEPTCTKEGSKEKSCSCGDKITESVIALGHNIVNNECSRCDYKEPVSSKDLEFKLNSDKASYSVTGIGACKDKDVVIPSTYNNLPVTSIGSEAFSFCTSLTSVTIPKSVTQIDWCAFLSCTSLEAVYIEDIVAWCKISFDGFPANPLDNEAKLYLSNKLVTDLVIPNGVTNIDFSFRGCTSLTSITIPDSVTSIGSGTFENCTSLESVTIGNRVTSIGSYAFSGCTSLTSITFSDSVTSIDDSIFRGCTSLASINVNNNNPNYKSIDGNLYNKNATILIQYAVGKKSTSFTIPNSVTNIGKEAFYDCTSLKSVTIPDSVTDIGWSTFADCTSLTSIVIPDSVTSIDWQAFYGCKSLKSVVIPNSVTSIGWDVFYGCKSLTIYCEAESQPSGWGSNWNSSNRPVVWGYQKEPVPSKGLIFELNADNASYSLVAIGTCKDKDVVIPSTYNGLPVTIIWDFAFESAYLTSLFIPNSVIQINPCAFGMCNCESLTIYCEAESKPSGWADDWNYFECPVVWGYKG